MNRSVGIVDYGVGNLRSVAGAVEKVGFVPVVSADPAELEPTAKLILPGVGAFGDGMANLRARGLVTLLQRLVIAEGRPVLGICLGAELLAQRSDEFGVHEGLGWIDADVTRITPADPGLRVPHVGWNEVKHAADSPLFDGIPDDALFYFVHSYHIRCADRASVIGEADYGGPIVAAVGRGHIWGTQFHPEKSQRHGLRLVQNFLSLV